MERKIGEVFKFGGEWYQCIRSSDCPKCDLKIIKDCRLKFPCESLQREDCEEVIFKKLEKVGEPFYTGFYCSWVQKYKLYENNATGEYPKCHFGADYVLIEVKQNKKEDMKIDRVVMNIDDRNYLLDRLDAILHDTHCQQYKDEICEALSKYIVTRNTFDLKPFDLNSAKAGKPVCTRDGRKARIISCSLKNKNFPIAAIVEDEEENVYQFEANGVCDEHDENLDLMMLPEKKTGWININKDGGIFKSREEAERNCSDDYFVVEVEWEE